MARAFPLADRDLHDKSEDSWWNWLKWVPTSNSQLILAEDKILQRCLCKLEKFFLPIFDSKLYIRTIIARNFPNVERFLSKDASYEDRVPLVLIHGFGAGLGLWCKNLDSLSQHRRVYAFDMLGFGRSSRPDFPDDAEEVENKFVDTIEEWRKNMNLDKFIAVGHSMGGFLASSYALRYPERIVHLVLVDPWGFVGQEDQDNIVLDGFRGWVVKKLSSFRALTTMRIIGPFGQRAMRGIRQDFERIFFQQSPKIENSIPNSAHLNQSEGPNKPLLVQTDQTPNSGTVSTAEDVKSMSPFDPAIVYNYMYHINVRHPSGEDAFKSMSRMLGWAARPMIHRIPQLDPDVPITFIYGGRSWIDMSSGLKVRSLRPDSYVDVMVIEGGGHHAYAQYADEFNNYLNTLAILVDDGRVFLPGSRDLLEPGATVNTTRPSAPAGSGSAGP